MLTDSVTAVTTFNKEVDTGVFFLYVECDIYILQTLYLKRPIVRDNPFQCSVGTWGLHLFMSFRFPQTNSFFFIFFLYFAVGKKICTIS